MPNPEMRAVILAGGKGSRLRPFTFVIPKPLIPVAELPIIEILIRQLAHYRFTRVTIAVGDHAALIEGICGDGKQWNIPVDYLYEEMPLGTAGSLALLDDLDADRVLVVNGDTLTDIDFGAAHRLHDPTDAMTIYSGHREITVPFGVLESNDEECLTSYLEKPTLLYSASIGIYVLSSWAIEAHFAVPRHIDMPEVAEALVKDGHSVRVRHTDASWLDLGRMDDLEAATAAFEAEPERFLAL